MSDESDGFDLDALIDGFVDEEQNSQANETEALKPSVSASTAKKVEKAPIGAGNVSPVDLTVRSFAPIEKYFEDKPNPVFSDASYYKTALGGEGESAQRLHALLSKYLKCTDKKDRAVYRLNMVAVYWSYLTEIAPKMVNTRLPLAKRLAMRFGVLLPSLFTEEQKDFFSKSILDNVTGEPVLYMDEWIREVAVGNMLPSTTDEVRVRGPGNVAAKAQGEVNKQQGKVQSAENLLSMKEAQRDKLELDLKGFMDEVLHHDLIMGMEPHCHPYSDVQRKGFSDINTTIRELLRLDKEIAKYIDEIREANKKIDDANMTIGALKEAEKDSPTVDEALIKGELGTMRQMAKMTCGRQGNQFPVFTREFFHCMQSGTGFRENVIRELAWIESIDPNAFVRIHKSMPNRIVPFVLLVPSYGDKGFCWEPYDKYNKVSSRGRIAIPMYPRSLKIACLTAVADLRWQVAKEKASIDWMSEGLTGMYYQWIESQKLKGDLKQFFIADYIMWITKESLGQQQLPKEVRAIFWRHIPFTQETKDKLKKMSLTYQELCQRDVNRSMSDGY